MLFQNLRAARRRLAGSPGFTVAVILTIGMGVGIVTSMFSLIDAVLLSPLPYPDADRLTFISMGRVDQSTRRPLSGPELVELASGSSLHSGMAAVWPTDGTLVEDGRPEPLRLGVVTSNFLSLLGVAPVLGRPFTQADEGSGAAPAMILSGHVWQGRFGGADVIGRRVRLDGGWGYNGGIYTIVGVMPAGFEMHLPLDASVPTTVEAWIPFAVDLAAAPRGGFYLRVVGRMKPEAALRDAQEETQQVGEAMMKRTPGYGPGRRFSVVSLPGEVLKNATTPLLMLQVTAALILLIAVLNVASLMLVRARAHSRDIAVRMALGAPARLSATVLFTESLLLALAGGLLGILLAYVALQVVVSVSPETLPRAQTASLSLPVLGMSLLATLGTGALLGFAAYLQSRRADVVTLLKTGGPGRTGMSPRWRHVLVVTEIALSLVLLIGAGLLIRTFWKLHTVHPGYHAEEVLSFKLSLPFERYGDPSTLARFSREIEQRLRAVPGVTAAGAVNQLPLEGSPNWATAYRTRTAAETGPAPTADARLATPGYFDALKVTVVRGRAFTEKDDEKQPLVLMVDERLAQKAWPGGDPLGQELAVQVWSADSGFSVRWGTVVGVVGHLRHHNPSEEVREQVFVPFAQAPRHQMGVVVRSAVDMPTLIGAVTSEVRQLDANLGMAQIVPLADYVGRKEAPARFVMTLSAVFGGLSLLLACVGMYGLISYSVTERGPELAVRAALGAHPSSIVRLVVRRGAQLTAVGLVLGVAASLAGVRWMKSLLFGITTLDPITFGAALLLLGLTALLACYIPARRAAAIDPVKLLRAE